MPSINYKKTITLIILLIFVVSIGCTTLNSPEIASESTPKIKPYQILVEPEPDKPYVNVPLKEGESAPSDGVWFDKESAIQLLAELTAYRGLKAEVQIQNQMTEAYVEQINLLRQANDLQSQANSELRKEIENKRKWDTVKNWLSVAGAMGALALGIWAGK